MDLETTTMTADADGEEDDFDFDEDEIVKLVSVVILCILGIPGNTTILLVYAKKKKKTSTDILIIVQAAVDFVASVFAPLVLLKTAYSNLVTDGVCVVTELTENGSAFSSLFLMMMISIDRYLLVCRPFQRRITVRTSVIISVCCILIAIAIMMPRTIYTQAVNSDLELEVNCEFPLSRRAYVFVSVIFPVTFFLTMLITFVLYGQIYAFLRRQSKIHAELVGSGPGARDVPLPTTSVTPPDEDATATGATLQDTTETAAEQHPIANEERRPVPKSQLEGPENQSLPEPTGKAGLSFASVSTAVKPHVAAAATGETLPTGQAGPSTRNPSAATFKATASVTADQSAQPEAAALNHPKKRVAHIRGRSTTKMLLFITVYFFITWLPLIIITLLQQQVIRNLTTNFMAIVIGSFETFRSTNHVVNIFVYSYTNVPFRNAARKLFTLEGIKGKIW